MPRVTWLPAALRDAGLEVIELAGWAGRGENRLNILGVVAHHTATGPNVTDQAVAAVLRDGRPDLKGPLAQLGLDRRGRLWMIADGRCSHNGFGLWANDAIGIEAFNDGVGEHWAAVQIDAYERAVAAICAHQGWTSDRLKAHRETDPRRKIDPTGIDMTKMRVHVGDVMASGRGNDKTATTLELTMDQYQELKADLAGIKTALGAIRSDIWVTKAELDDVTAAVMGTNDANRDQSIKWNTIYLRGELLGGDNLTRLRYLLQKYGSPDAPDPPG